MRWVLLSVCLCLVSLTGCGQPAPNRAQSQDQSVATALNRVETAIRESDAGLLPTDLGYLATNAKDLRVRDFTLRWADELAVSGEEVTGSVQVSYRFEGFDKAETRTTVAMTFITDGGRTQLRDIGGHGEREPLWLSGPVVVRGDPDSLAILSTSIPQPDQVRIGRMAGQAITRVRAVLPDAAPIVVEVPKTVANLEQALLASPGEYDNIAAVATSPDGSLVPGTPVHVFVNPDVFFSMNPGGAGVVLTHEATHVATGALFAELPAWLREGFADYVALLDAGIPTKVAAQNYLARVRESGLPDRLPDDAELDPRSARAGTGYEAAWLLCRSIAEHFGQEKLVRLYRKASDGGSVPVVIDSVLGISEQELVSLWRSDLQALIRSAG